MKRLSPEHGGKLVFSKCRLASMPTRRFPIDPETFVSVGWMGAELFLIPALNSEMNLIEIPESSPRASKERQPILDVANAFHGQQSPEPTRQTVTQDSSRQGEKTKPFTSGR